MKESVLSIPKWFEEYRLDDTISANAYEEAKLEHKAAIKSAIALHFAVDSEQLPIRTMRTKGAFVLHEDTKPCIASIFVLNEAFNSPAQLIAGLMPALLAKSTVIVLLKNTSNQDVLLSLELLGIEHVFVISESERIERFCIELYKDYTLIVCANLGFDHTLANFAWKNAIPFVFYAKEPIILGNSILFEAAYPNANIYSDIQDIPENRRIDIALEGCIESENIGYPLLIIDKGLEFYTELLFPIDVFINKNRKFTFAE